MTNAGLTAARLGLVALMGTAATTNARTLLVTVVVAALVALTVRWALVVPDLPVSSDGQGIGAVSSGMAIASVELLVLGAFTALLLVRASRRGVVPASVVRAQAVLSVVLVAFLWTATDRMQARVEAIATTQPDWAKSPEDVDIEMSRLNRDYWDAIRGEWAMSNRVVAVQLVACWCALWAALQPNRRGATAS